MLTIFTSNPNPFYLYNSVSNVYSLHHAILCYLQKYFLLTKYDWHPIINRKYVAKEKSLFMINVSVFLLRDRKSNSVRLLPVAKWIPNYLSNKLKVWSLKIVKKVLFSHNCWIVLKLTWFVVCAKDTDCVSEYTLNWNPFEFVLCEDPQWRVCANRYCVCHRPPVRIRRIITSITAVFKILRVQFHISHCLEQVSSNLLRYNCILMYDILIRCINHMNSLFAQFPCPNSFCCSLL